MYFFDDRRHKTPHLHVRYQEQEAVIAIPEGELIEGQLRSDKLKLVQAWIEIIADWELASSGQAIFKIEPLK